MEGLGNHYQCFSQRPRTQKLPLFRQWQKFMQLSLVHCFFCHLVFQVQGAPPTYNLTYNQG